VSGAPPAQSADSKNKPVTRERRSRRGSPAQQIQEIVMVDTPIWTRVTGPSAGLVQQHYVAARKEALYRRDKDLETKVKEALRGNALLHGVKTSGDKWLEVYRKISANLQAADLTINFKADSWFSTENHYETYAQQYERSRRDASGAATFEGDLNMNPAKVRADQDDKITFNNLRTPGKPAASTQPQRGLMPGRQGIDRIRTQMEFRSSAQKDDRSANKSTVSSTNPHFNPKTKQVFAALNYGRRPHGSNIDYGTSHFVLSPKLKVNALYYPEDTFYSTDGSRQLAYHVLGAIVAYAKPDLLDPIIQSCYFGARLEDTSKARLMIEAHLFGEVRFTGSIDTMVLDAPFGSTIHENAKKFARKHGIRLILTDSPKNSK
jgi:hypothetical protein